MIDEMTVVEVTKRINKWVNECQTSREKSMLFNLINEITTSNIIWAMKMQQGYGKTDGVELDNLINIMRSFSIYSSQCDYNTDTMVSEIYNTFDALHKNCMRNYYAKRKM